MWWLDQFNMVYAMCMLLTNYKKKREMCHQGASFKSKGKYYAKSSIEENSLHFKGNIFSV